MDCQLKQAALSLSRNGQAVLSTTIARDDRLHYGSPACDVGSPNQVRVGREPTRLANKLGPALAVGLVDVAARWASTRGVARICGHKFDASNGGLVAEERSQLKERPSRMHRSLVLPDRYPFTDTRQVFDGSAAPGAFGLCDDVFRDHVIGVRTEAGLLARELLEMTLGRLGADRLKRTAKTLETLPRDLDGSAAVGLSIRVDSKVADAQVYAKPALGVDGRAIGHFDGHVEKPLALAQDKVGLAPNAFEPRAVVRSNDVGQKDAPRDANGGKDGISLAKALHICRGHFKNFDDKPLFGKLTGTYWWQPHVRGTAEAGIVEKDYRIKLGSEAPHR
jgi:hypothetical protein